MPSITERSKRLLAVIEALRRDGRVGVNVIDGLAGGRQEASEIMRILADANLAREEGGIVTLADSQEGLTVKQVAAVERYLLGVEDAKGFHSIMESLGAYVQPGIEEVGEILPDAPKRREEVDPEVVKRYVKGYIDVKEIADKQSREKKKGDK